MLPPELPRQDSVLRTSIEKSKTIDISERPVMPADAMVFRPIVAGQDDRGLAGRLALSVDWEQHSQCGGPDGAWERMKLECEANNRPPHTHVWRLQVALLSRFQKKDGTWVEPVHVVEWPIERNAAHSHVLVPANVDQKKANKAARNHIRVKAAPSLALYRPHIAGDVAGQAT